VSVKSDPGIRNLDQLQEDDDERKVPRAVTLALVVLGGACVAFAGLALGGRTSAPQGPKVDPLGDLVSQRLASAAPASPSASGTPRGHEAQPPPQGQASADLAPTDVTFPQILSDDDRPTTALAAVRPAGSAAASAPALVPVRPPPPTDRLPVVPLPAQAVLEASPIVTRPRDALTKAASDAAQITTPPASADVAPAGHEGGYQLQVSSFQTEAEADAFAQQLRARGHKAYVLEAHVPGRGTWYRVRIGPFATQHLASQYRATFEDREHVVPFIVPPETTARAVK
jgi:cell division septation protein DedD